MPNPRLDTQQDRNDRAWRQDDRNNHATTVQRSADQQQQPECGCRDLDAHDRLE
jgi:hypothetical protein